MIDLPSQYRPSTSCTVALISNTVVDYAQDGTPFVRSLGNPRYRVAVAIELLTDTDASALIGWLLANRTETLRVTLASGQYAGFLASQPARSWHSGSLSNVQFELAC